VISTETYSHWAGPIIDVLLDYVGHVKLCARLTEHLDSYDEWQCIKEKSSMRTHIVSLNYSYMQIISVTCVFICWF